MLQTEDLPWFYFNRGHAVSCLAMVLGNIQSVSNYYYTCVFQTEDLPLTHELGSGNGTISRDCGYQITFNGSKLVFDDKAENLCWWHHRQSAEQYRVI